MPDRQKRRREKLPHLRWEDNGRCTGCRACEVACSFHHTGAFQPERSSIRVERDDIQGRISLELSASCDQCPSERSPFCVRYCAPHALTTGLVRRRWATLSRSGSVRQEANS